MIRRLLNVAAVLSLLAAVLLAIAGLAYTPGRWWHVAGPVDVGNGLLVIGHVAVPLGVLALGFAVLPLPWVIVCFHRERRQRARGFPIEVSRHAPPVQPTADRGAEVPGREVGQAAQSQPDSEG